MQISTSNGHYSWIKDFLQPTQLSPFEVIDPKKLIYFLYVLTLHIDNTWNTQIFSHKNIILFCKLILVVNKEKTHPVLFAFLFFLCNYTHYHRRINKWENREKTIFIYCIYIG